MATNLKISDAKISKAVRLGKHKSKREAVEAALDLYIERQSAQGLIAMFGTVEYHPNHDIKKMRALGNKRLSSEK